MADVIQYTMITLHSKKGNAVAELFRDTLQGISYSDLQYDDPTENNSAVATWFRDDTGAEPNFGEGPILTYDEIYWIDPTDSSNVYGKRKYRLHPQELPTDFLTKAV